ncbi:TPA: hypothetical protein ACH3X1_013672 [Trebouxia sp. C0004]
MHCSTGLGRIASLLLAAFKHTVILTGAMADLPAQNKMSKNLHWNNALTCAHCTLNGTWLLGATRFLGYRKPVVYGIKWPSILQVSEPKTALFGDACTKLRPEAWANAEGLGQCIADGKGPPGMKEGDVGNKGISMFKKMLPYICPSNFWVIPFGHALLLGILQDFLKMMLPALTGSMADYCIKKEARTVMIARAAMIHSTIDFGRPYSDAVQKRGYWVMEELLHFTETWSVIIFQPYKKGSAIIPILHDKDTLEMWQSFRVIVHHFMRSFAEHASDAACDKVALHLRRYSQGVEKVFGPSQCKYNLHHVVPLDQQRARGLTAEELEFWVENCIQLCKSTIKHRCSREPERLLVNSLLVRHALAVVKRDHGYRDGQPYVGTFDERIPEYRNAPLAVSVTDDGDDVTHTQLLGLGQDPAPEDWPVLLPNVQQAVQDYPELWQEHFSSLALEQCCITKFKRAQVRGGEIVLSEAYERITSRFSHFVVVEWEGEGIFAKVKYFVKVDVAEQEGPFEGSGKPLRYAIADLYKQGSASQASRDVGKCFMVTKQQQQRPVYPVNVEDIRAKVLWAEAARCVEFRSWLS